MNCLVPTKPEAPKKWSDSRATQIYLRWNPVTGDSVDVTYTVRWNSTPPDGSVDKTGIINTETIISGLHSNTAYTFTVAAVNDAGSGEESDGTTIATGLLLS